MTCVRVSRISRKFSPRARLTTSHTIDGHGRKIGGSPIWRLGANERRAERGASPAPLRAAGEHRQLGVPSKSRCGPPRDAALIFRGDEQLLPTESGRLPAGESARIARSPGREPRGEPGPWANQASCSFSTLLRVDENGDGCDACSFITLPRRSSAGVGDGVVTTANGAAAAVGGGGGGAIGGDAAGGDDASASSRRRTAKKAARPPCTPPAPPRPPPR